MSFGKTTTENGHDLASLQKLRNVTPFEPFSICSTVPVTQSVVPTCSAASANDTRTDFGGLPAAQIPLNERKETSKADRMRKRIETETIEVRL